MSLVGLRYLSPSISLILSASGMSILCYACVIAKRDDIKTIKILFDVIAIFVLVNGQNKFKFLLEIEILIINYSKSI